MVRKAWEPGPAVRISEPRLNARHDETTGRDIATGGLTSLLPFYHPSDVLRQHCATAPNALIISAIMQGGGMPIRLRGIE
jgi:hypothetical protein